MLPSPITPVRIAGPIVRRKPGLYGLLVLLLLAGCTGRNQYFQALEPGAESIDGRGLLLLPLHVWPLESNLKVSGMLFVDPVTGNRHRVVLYEDPSLGSAALGYHKRQLEVAQYAALELPAGRYRLVSLDLVFLWQQADAGIASVAATRDWTLAVGDAAASYAGRLSVEIESLTVTDLYGERTYRFPLEEPVRIYGIDSQIRVEARLRVDDRMDEDLRAMRTEYPVLEDLGVDKNLLR